MRRHLAILTTLLALSAAVQCWAVWHAVTPALDAVRYASIAQGIATGGFWPTVRVESEHPLYPALVYLASLLVKACRGDIPDLWAQSVQLAAAAPLVLAVVPAYGVLTRMFSRRIAAAGSILFCLLPEVARLGADGISDSTHLLFGLLALWAIATYLTPRSVIQENRSPYLLLMAGLAVGLALLARAEAILILPALVLTLLWTQLRGEFRQSWTRVAAGLALLTVGLGLVLIPYLAVVEAASPRAAIARVLGRGDGPSSLKGSEKSADAVAAWRFADGAAMSFSVKETSVTSRFRGYPAAIKEYAEELAKTFQYWAGALALCGVWAARPRNWRPIDMFAACLFTIVSLATIHVAASAGYLASRHLLLLVPIGLGYAAAGLEGVLSLLRWPRKLSSSSFILHPSSLCLTVSALVFLSTLPLHASRAGHRQAAEWLTQGGRVPGSVLDTRGLTGLYSGRLTRRYDAAAAMFADPRLAYVVVERHEMTFDSERGRTLRRLLATAGQSPIEFHGPSGDSRETVLVYRWQPARFARLLSAIAQTK